MTPYGDLPLFQTREEALDALQVARLGYVEAARNVALRLLQAQPTICIDDVRAVLPPPDNVDPRVMGAVFNSKLFRKVGYTQGQACGREAYHTRPVALFARGDFRLSHDPITGLPVEGEAA